MNGNNTVYYMTMIIQLFVSAVLVPDQILAWLCFFCIVQFVCDQHQE